MRHTCIVNQLIYGKIKIEVLAKNCQEAAGATREDLFEDQTDG